MGMVYLYFSEQPHFEVCRQHEENNNKVEKEQFNWILLQLCMFYL